MNIVCLNGEFVDLEDARLAPTDAGFLLGDGVFETMRVESGQLLFAADHFARLGRGLRMLEIPLPFDPEGFLELCQQVIDANGLTAARLRVTVSRGPMRGLPITSTEGEPTLLAMASPLDDRLDAQRDVGVSAMLSSVHRNHRSPLAGIKSTSYGDSLAARREATRRGFDEAILMNTDGRIAEAAMANLFVVRDGRVATPPTTDGALPGVVRGALLRLARIEGIEAHEEPLAVTDLANADEAFLTNAMIQVMPVTTLGGRRLGSGHPGPMTRRLYALWRAEVARRIDAARR